MGIIGSFLLSNFSFGFDKVVIPSRCDQFTSYRRCPQTI
jgi:hypothetical protein